MAVLGRLQRAEIDSAPDPKRAVAEAVFGLIFDRDEAELTPRQRVVRLALVYENEVDNGGHLQYFHNQGMADLAELRRALAEIGADGQREILEQAAQYAIQHPVDPADSLEGYHERATEQEFRGFDTAFYACRTRIGDDLLADYIQAHRAEFVELG